MTNPKPSLQTLARTPIFGSDGMMHQTWQRVFAFLFQQVDPALNQKGQIQATTSIAGRTEKLQTTVTNITNSGAFNSLGNVVDTSTDHLTDGTGSPLTGGKRGFNALDTHNRLVGTFRNNAVNVGSVPGSSTTLSNDGVATSVTINADTAQFGDGTVSYNSGSVDMGSFGGPQYIYADDPTFAGGAVTYTTTPTQQNQSAANGRVIFGAITTVNGAAKTGGGTSGGSGGTRGGRQYI
jgi:hypothetical protein